MFRNTLHCWHIFIFFCQLSWTFPWQTVPLINQQRCLAWNSHVGHFRLSSLGHFRITQQGLLCLASGLSNVRRNSTWRSVCTGMFLHPCSKLCMALRETPNNCAIWLCVFPKYWRVLKNSSFSTENIPFSFVPSYHNVAGCKGLFPFLLTNVTDHV